MAASSRVDIARGVVFPFVATQTQFAPVPKAKDTGATYEEHPISSGPYKVVKNEGDGQHMVLEHNPHWSEQTDEERHAYPDTIDVKAGLDAAVINQRLSTSSGADSAAITTDTNLGPAELAQVGSDKALTERALTVLTLAGTGMPVFILGLLLLMLVCAYMRWLPFPSYVPLSQDPEQWAWNMLLPWLTLGFFESAKYARLTRSSTLETLAEDHIRMFRAYGVGERAVVTRHALRGAVPPVIALNANDLGSVVGGAVLTETLFGIPGIGKTLVDAVRLVDVPVVVGVVLVTGTAVVLANVVADLLYAAADRRVALL